ILLNGTSGSTVKNCVISDFENLIMLEGSNHNRIFNNTLFNSGTFGVGLAKSNENTIFNNRGDGNDFLVGGFGSNNNIIELNDATNGQNGMEFSGANNTIRFNCRA
ncbi:right-handed parallel beta-helix repeat-containing protein, partial [Streptococcus pseudopneumoniae]|uniref:right-handed parallel beta-helix repeat-containing protein n=1 Tax=Streptococcus pseudopneumoniae TaxID=257758 RepID=UPI001485E8C9